VRGLKGGEDIPLPASGARQRPGKRDTVQRLSKAQDDEVMQRRASSLPTGTVSEDALAGLTEHGTLANGLRSEAKNSGAWNLLSVIR
jgi:hypothetical protein